MFLDVSEPHNIWAKNPRLRTLKKAVDFHEQFGEEWFNKIYYAIYLVYDPISEFRITTTDEKVLRKEVKESFFTEEEQKNLNWADLRPLVSEFKANNITKESIRFSQIEKSLADDEKFFNDYVTTCLEDIVKKRTAMKALSEMWRELNDAKKEAMNASRQNSGSTYGSTHLNLAMDY